ncbi:exodeoxyribonuclease VII large subunit [soil metagenome]
MPNGILHIRLSELNKQIQAVIENNFNELILWVIADITNHSFKEKTNYHYFDLVEKAESSNELVAKISGKAWGTGSSKIREFERITGQKFSNNINVLVRVKVNYHIVFGLSLDIQDIDTNFTIGVLEQQRQATLASLVANNPAVIAKIGDRYITRNAKLPLPMIIQRIAVVSSKTSAGNEDFRHTLLNNPYGYKFEIHDYHTVVQNEANAQQFLERLIDVFKSNIQFDAVIINRGGGAQTDFLIFDNYKIGLAVARFPIPIITGIGHQKNETITDLMAHTQTKTPTKAAEFIITHNRHFEDAILNFQKSILIKSQQTFSSYYQRLTFLKTSVVNNSRTFLNDYKDALVTNNQIVINKTKTILFHNKNNLSFIASTLVSKPKILTSNKLNDLANTLNNVKSFKAIYLKRQTAYLGHFVSVINLMSPNNILKKGFAIVKLNGDVTSNPDVFNPGSEMEVILLDKSIKSTVKSKSNHNGNEFNL